ncbi:MAG: enoyl-CoA hydratase, partial [Acetobacteraceae bacterium]|nr:enoyl-CoA hydratase [Acetobacteraceae bacterium]
MADILESIEEGVGVLTLNRPDRLNALSQQILGGLREGLARMAEDEAVGAIVITGAGRGFCAGGDVKDMANRKAQSFEERVARLSRVHELPQVMRRHPKVIIGMVNGPAFGAGLGLAMACDLRIAARTARFGTAFANIGYSGDFGGSWLLTQLVGPAKAREMYLLAEPIDAERAEAIGLVNRVVDDSALAEETMALARRLAAGPRLAYGYIKRNLNAAETETLAAVCDMEAVHQA